MTVGELIEKLHKYSADAEVCVKVTKCMSPSVAEPVTGVCRGFDWTMGKVMLYTKDNLIREHETCRQCGMYGVKAAQDILSRCNWLDMNTGDMEIAFYLGKKKMFSVPFNVRKQQESDEEPTKRENDG